MFDYSLAHWLTFVGAGLALEFTPGPSMLYVLGQTARHGRRHGLVGLAGVLSGGVAHIVLTVFGLAALIAQSAWLFSMIKWIGAIYLVWLGVQSLCTRSSDDVAETAATDHRRAVPSAWRAYRQGLLIDLFNPKVALFFLAFIPQFVVAGAGPVAVQLGLHGVLLLALAAVCDTPLVLIGDRLSRWFKGRRRLALWSERGLGALFVALGARLALAHR
ncbi:LysE family translocator [Salinisphaera sp. SPP-AMP-43]|uniref:LysE family translocator n=1 Tax=Salinisphaera sp. SPP-AMP-43 TaxID=3121288 RepID=UPI003C6DD761